MRGVMDPELNDNIVDLGMLGNVEIAHDGVVTVWIALTTAGCPLRAQLRAESIARVGSLPGVIDVVVETTEMDAEQKRALMNRARLNAQTTAPTTEIPATTRIIAVSSGKGGVGKSSVSANLAAGLAQRGYTVGVLDADIWGFSMPRMLGVEGKVQGERKDNGRPRMQPLVRNIGDKGGSLRVLSMGFLAQEDSAIMWRGLILNRALQHFLEDVEWGQLDYLVIDMPPGTGDIQMGLARMLPRAEMLIVTTPTIAAQKVASRAADMARRGHLRVAGVIENMSAFACDHGTSYPLFGSGGGQTLADEIGAPLLGSIPLQVEVSSSGDSGNPTVLAAPSSASGVAFNAILDRIVDEVLPPIEMASCTARMMDLLNQL